MYELVVAGDGYWCEVSKGLSRQEWKRCKSCLNGRGPSPSVLPPLLARNGVIAEKSISKLHYSFYLYWLVCTRPHSKSTGYRGVSPAGIDGHCDRTLLARPGVGLWNNYVEVWYTLPAFSILPSKAWATGGSALLGLTPNVVGPFGTNPVLAIEIIVQTVSATTPNPSFLFTKARATKWFDLSRLRQ